MNRCLPAFLLLFSAFACTEVTPDPTGSMAQECVPTADTETSCSDGIDNDCNGVVDCAEAACIEDPACVPSDGTCGEANFGGDPLAIPDGEGSSYETTISIDGFTDGQTLLSADGFQGVCVDMEHSWLRDLQIELECPSGQVLMLQEFLGKEGSELFMGTPDDSDYTDPVPGTPGHYCWTASAVNPPMLDYANQNPTIQTLPEGDYQPSSPTSDLVGCTLNGDWTLRVTDDWAIDNGYIFSWTIDFNPNIIADCSDWIE